MSRIIWYKLSDVHLSNIEPMNSMGIEPPHKITINNG